MSDAIQPLVNFQDKKEALKKREEGQRERFYRLLAEERARQLRGK